MPLIEIHSVDSTNNYAMRQLENQAAEHGVAYFAYEQYAGKGQRGKQWYAQPGSNIILSVVFNTSPLQVSKQFAFSMAVSMAAHDLFSFYTQENTFVKWPNDLYSRDRKAGGILIENILRGQYWQWAVAGIGININQTVFDPSISNATSLKRITGKTYNPVQLSKELCKNLEQRYIQLINHGGGSLLKEFNDVLYKRNEMVRLKKSNVSFEALIKGVNEFGQLLVEAGTEQTFNVGEIEWMTT